MAPKKSAAPKTDAGGADADGDKFSWSAENERLLLLLCLGRSHVGSAEYTEFLKAMPGSTFNGIRFRMQKFRKDQRELYAAKGITLSGADNQSTPVGKKRAASTEPRQDSPKKARGKKAKVAEIPQADADEGLVKEEKEDSDV